MSRRASSGVRSAIREPIEAKNLSRSPGSRRSTFGEVSSAVPTRWKTFGASTVYPQPETRSAISAICGRSPNASMKTSTPGPDPVRWASAGPSGVWISMRFTRSR
jgi:hypothetical protein